jgi:putative urate catabolism protein
MTTEPYPRDLIGYGSNPPNANWLNGARIAVNFVVNYEEGGENCLLHGDEGSEGTMTDMPSHPSLSAWPGRRNLLVESIFEYGSRAGIWRFMRIFAERKAHFTVFAVGMALERNPDVARAMADAGHEIATHGYRWVDYSVFEEADEREHIRLAVQAGINTTGQRPLGWFGGRVGDNSRRLAVEEGGFLYDSDSFADDLPYWVEVEGKALLIVPYNMDANDGRFSTAQGFNSGDQFYTYLKDTFDVLYAEGKESPRMMSVGLHPRLSGRPGRAAALARFIDYVQSHDKVWLCRRIEIARHWIENHPYAPTESS